MACGCSISYSPRNTATSAHHRPCSTRVRRANTSASSAIPAAANVTRAASGSPIPRTQEVRNDVPVGEPHDASHLCGDERDLQTAVERQNATLLERSEEYK